MYLDIQRCKCALNVLLIPVEVCGDLESSFISHHCVLIMAVFSNWSGVREITLHIKLCERLFRTSLLWFVIVNDSTEAEALPATWVWRN